MQIKSNHNKLRKDRRKQTPVGVHSRHIAPADNFPNRAVSISIHPKGQSSLPHEFLDTCLTYYSSKTQMRLCHELCEQKKGMKEKISSCRYISHGLNHFCKRMKECIHGKLWTCFSMWGEGRIWITDIEYFLNRTGFLLSSFSSDLSRYVCTRGIGHHLT